MAEHAPTHEHQSAPEVSSNHSEHLRRHAERQAESHQAVSRSLEEIRSTIQEQAKSTQELQLKNHEQPHEPHHAYVTRSLKLIARRRMLRQVRQHLSAPDKVFSQVIHQPVIDHASEIAAKTIARPSGIFTGGLCALIASGGLLFIDKHYGYTYKFYIWLLSFIGGFIVGLCIELLWFAIRKYRT